MSRPLPASSAVTAILVLLASLWTLSCGDGTGVIAPLDGEGECLIRPTEIRFGEVTTGAFRDTTVTMFNTGDGILFGHVVVGDTTGSYSIVQGGGRFELDPGDIRRITVRFAPGLRDSIHGTVRLTTLCRPVPVSGYGGEPPDCAVEPDFLDFGTLVRGELVDATVTVVNRGGGQLPIDAAMENGCNGFSIVRGGGATTLAAGDTLRVTVRFSPTEATSYFCNLELGPECPPVSCVGSGAPPPPCRPDPAAVDFGTVVIGRPAESSFTIFNQSDGPVSGTAAASCSEVTVDPATADFALAPGASQQIRLRFDPTTEGAIDCAVSTGCGPDIPVTGIAIEGDPVCGIEPAAIDLGVVFLGDTAETTFTVTNLGDGTLAGTASSPCPAFTIDGGSYALRRLESRVVTVRFTADELGLRSCTIASGCGEALEISATVEDLPLECTVDPESLDFGAVVVGDTASASFVIENVGRGDAAGTVISSCGEIVIDPATAAFDLTPGETHAVLVRFIPTAAGPVSCILDTGCDATVAATGLGEDPVPVCAPSTDQLTFGQVVAGDSLSTSFTVTNGGTGTLTGFIAADCEDFLIVSGGGAYSVRAGEFHTVTVRFAPRTPGDKTCAIDTGCGETVTAMGTGLDQDPVCSVDPESVDFGTVILGDTAFASFALENGGGGTLVGTAVSLCSAVEVVPETADYSLATGESHTVELRFVPTVASAVECVVSTGCGLSVTATGIGEEPPPACTVGPVALDFGEVTFGTTADRTFTVTNTGGGTLTGTVTSPCPELTVVSGASYALAGKASQVVTVRFTPAAPGTLDCTLDTGSPCDDDVAVTAVGLDPPPVCDLDTDAVDFGTVSLGDTAFATVTLTNTGGGTLTGTVTSDCAEVTLSGASYALGAGESAVVTARFHPATAGDVTCTLDPGAGCDPVTATGTGEALPECSVSRTTIDYGTVTVGGFGDETFTITNTGGGTLTGTVGFQGSCSEFLIVTGGGAYELETNESQLVRIQYVPSSAGSHACTVDTGCDDTVALSGNAEEPVPVCSVSTGSLSFGDVVVGQQKNLFFTITNTGGGTLSGTVGFSGSCGDFGFVSGGGSYALGANEMRTVVVAYTPSSFDPDACTVTTGTSCSPNVSLSGNGAVSFSAHIRPIVTKVKSQGGCADSGCHNWTYGQVTVDNFRLLDFGNPDNSRFLLKPTAQISHSGGFIWSINGSSYTTVRKWIVQGAPNN